MNFFDSFFDDSTVTIWGWVLVHFLWQGTFVALLGWIALSLCSNCSAQIRYLIATGCLSVAAACPIVTAIELSRSDERVSITEPVPIDDGSKVTLVSQHSRVETIQPEFRDFEAASNVEAVPSGTLFSEQPFVTTYSWRDRLESTMPWIVTGWFLGVIVLTIRLIGGWWLASREVANGKPLRADWMSAVERLTRQLQIRRAVRWVESVRIDVPQVIGWWKPVVLVPVSMLSSLTPREVECLLIHELAHIRRFDFAVNLMQCLIETILFFHPGVWWLSRRIRLERELACDETTLRITGDQFTFSRALLSLADLAQLPQPTLAAIEGDLTKRVHAILGTRRAGSSHVGAVFLSLIACVTVAGVIFWMGPQETPSESETVSKTAMAAAIERFAGDGVPVPELSGQILDANGDPVADAVVYLRQSGRVWESEGGPTIWEDLAKTTSDSEGFYRFTDVFDFDEATSRVNPQFDIVASKAEYSLGWKHIRPKAEGATVNVTLAQSESIVGRITDEFGQPVSGAKVWLKHLMSIRHITQADLEQGRWPSWSDSNFVSLHGFREPPSATTDEDGHFELSGVIENSGAILEIAHPDYLLETAFTATVAELDPETAAKTKRNVQTGEIKISLKRGYRVELMVVDDETGQPIPNARYAETHKRYRLVAPEPRTETGSISIPHLASPKFQVRVFPPENTEYLGFGQYLDWPEGEYVRKLEVRLKKGIPVTGSVVSAENGEGVAAVDVYAIPVYKPAEVPVYATPIDKNPEKNTSISPSPFVTDPQGRFTAIVSPGDYMFHPRVRVRGFLEIYEWVSASRQPDRYKSAVVRSAVGRSEPIHVTEQGASQELQIQILPAPRFRLIVTDPAGNPAPGIKISTRAHSSSLNRYMPIDVTTDKRGEYLLDQLFMSYAPAQGILGEEVVFRSRDNVLGAQLILVRPNDDTPIEQTVEVKLKQLGTVTGRTVDELGQPVAGTSIWLYKQNYKENGSSAVGEFTTTDADGRFELKGVLPGIEHSLSLSHTRYRVPNSIHTLFTLGDSNDCEFGDIKLGSLTPPKLAAVTAPDVSDLSPEAAFEKLESSYTADFQKYRDQFDELKQKYSAKDIIARRAPAPAYCQEFLKLAQRDPQSEIALKSCIWIVNSPRIPYSKFPNTPKLHAEAEKMIAANFLERPEMSQCLHVAITSFMKDPDNYSPDYFDRYIAATEQLMQRNTHREVHASVYYFLSEGLIGMMLDQDSESGESPSKKNIELCRTYLTRLKDEFPEYEPPLKRYGEVEQMLYDLDHMLVGQTPPDLEGTDVTGKSVKLSDYRGKLLIVDFWQGFDPATHDHHGLKHILEKAGDRVVVVGIVSDSKEEVLQVVEKYNLTYPVIADGHRGPLFNQWNIHTWPTTFLLDEQGKILHRGQRGTTFENLLLEKLAEE